MELRHIRYFLALAEELNFSRAAEKLHIAQPPLSKQIKELEEEIGAKLFNRTKRHVELTNAGQVFLDKSYKILDQVEQACISTRLTSTGTEGELVIGFSGSVQDLIPTIQRYRERYPKFGIVLQQLSTTIQVKNLIEKKIDIGILAAPINSSKIHVRPVKKVCLRAIIPEKHPLAIKQSIYIHDLENEPFIMATKSAAPFYYETFMNLFQSVGFAPKITVQANDLQTVSALVANGMGVALLPSSINPLSGLIHRKVEDINTEIEASLAWRKDNKSELLEKFLELYFEFNNNEE
ncbi:MULTISPECIES: LysR substrate-binding domain-containing protein [Bacillus cereus group]|uniref:LysR substrate-binding domain-containing protein n=1 Tax=Bacillus cereus group TaxID=86661 RepID=UPI000446B42E|nr:MULTISPECIES: LysR substrate-binding domain-containing protein [Bacillus cereus group]EXY04715.1 LysR family transcriptional regulator [Bacillus thuringiensis]MEB8637720.1 LysR substrate-binding domain-containing protein [Bacillus cereus]MEB8745894.1 LysR substrate-binding domain-containing protein [Bacillus cereus]MEB8799813.1 LysR substrate-binding domain-containing protein [Bacillus cereus]MEB8810244.1 LysR substrate-binding domain-containing protein [Bacillus cereus]